jgi:hypothetical protein
MSNDARPDPRVVDKPGPIALGTGIATLAIAVPFMAVAVGLIETAEPVHWALRVFLFLFAAPFVAIGGLLVVGGFAILVDAAVPGDTSIHRRAPIYLLRQMAKPRHLIAALPMTLIVAQYYAVSRTGEGFFGVSAELLERGILLEFFAIHATGFLGVLALIPARGRLRILKIAGFGALSVLYLVIAFNEGWAAALFLAGLILLKLAPFLATPPDLHTGATLGLRWGFQMIVFLSVFSFFGGLESLRAGTIYWSIIMLAELFGMTEAEYLGPPEPPSRPDNI